MWWLITFLCADYELAIDVRLSAGIALVHRLASKRRARTNAGSTHVTEIERGARVECGRASWKRQPTGK